VCFCYKDQPVIADREVVPVHCKTRTEHINTLCGQNVVSLLNLAVCILTNEFRSVGKATGRGMNDCGSITREGAIFKIIIMSRPAVRLIQQYMKIYRGGYIYGMFNAA
jgi:hypothetical protein